MKSVSYPGHNEPFSFPDSMHEFVDRTIAENLLIALKQLGDKGLVYPVQDILTAGDELDNNAYEVCIESVLIDAQGNVVDETNMPISGEYRDAFRMYARKRNNA